MARQEYYEYRANIRKPKYKVYQFARGKWRAVITMDDLDKLKAMYGGMEDFIIKDQETGKIVT